MKIERKTMSLLNKTRVIYNYVLCKLGIRDILPSEIINRCIVVDNSETLVTIPLKYTYGHASEQKIRKQVNEMLCEANKNLQVGYSIVVTEGYRSLSKQQVLWDKEIERLKTIHPEYSNSDLVFNAKISIANPTSNSGGGHQTGGAIDVKLMLNDLEVDMGTDILEFNRKTKTDSEHIDSNQRNNRAILNSAMATAGFVNYPAEWWHFSYGDKMWAAYLGKRYAVYGPLKG